MIIEDKKDDTQSRRGTQQECREKMELSLPALPLEF